MYLPSFSLEGKTALITGAGRGIGRALAIGFAEAGADVVLISRTRSDLDEVAGSIEKLGRKAYAFTVDVTVKEEIQSLYDSLTSRQIPVHILVNNAGMNIRSKALEVSEEEWEKIMNTNLRSAFYFSQEAAKLMKSQGNGRIINISSVAGHVALRTGVVYASTKAAMIQMTKNLALEWGPYGINVNSIGPWYFRTPLTAELLADENYLNDILSRTPLNRVGELAELVGPAVFLSSDAGSYCTGQTLFVDGGMTVYGF
ncbi:glucose 1-dehydrogenase [Fictibacillus sp. WQ 8-8]|uniref:SDR family NAD(P)-dependent oxidoreductase n=1 Tax=unclassified Fictibacillus TaxID=2644029 RepID=UPI0007861A2A|nr:MULTISPECIES: glucose 1-dehydrogenase [unclassified Fictibacillus]MCQ6266908.1 glucose 1-dehydrogenase [Fictibacillus sp. WQ 8-8]MED2973941.1 glucose 1-dehydrogenase [Fictibacillus sp. B-59209]SFF18189.1 NAD(P)-dependent dehydrogenase, short-chain alcohol dehydrogenase family [Bacillus sp. OV194]